MNTVTVKNVVIGAGIPKICIPIVATAKEDIIKEAKNLLMFPVDIVEWRVDWFEHVEDFEQVIDVLKELNRVLTSIPLLFTFRTIKEGGVKEFETKAYIDLLKSIINTQLIDFIDVEIFTGDNIVQEIINKAHENGVKVIASNHDFKKTPPKEEIVSRLLKMQEIGADIAKIAVMPNSKMDVLVLLEATLEMSEKHADRPIITMSMADLGVISRLSGQVFGSSVTFASAQKASAPGQIPAKQLEEVLHILNQGMKE
ncbi:type I 3-dehydroquinate dehydratase [Candidatus Galacturonibacter soehngenii]|uniref:3-dehydroquinate dehydratase n=1 Tax=Candidatus Galacturonatibacter soehngenii TaxID=2307010 RepID=A0A7V7UDC4_9FIRM|nr:type I 3-dehydroquinate dehydratase [Candidatus Galacturonibacter soehngenii]KAB1440625.1 type I 3-dehydroquinate dehydratase [Candidatus Galacturonibacter soehngenii]